MILTEDNMQNDTVKLHGGQHIRMTCETKQLNDGEQRMQHLCISHGQKRPNFKKEMIFYDLRWKL